MKTVSKLKDSVSALLSGINLNNVSDLYGAFERGARTLIQKADVIEATGRYNVSLYNGVYDYAAPTDIFGGALFDLRPQGTSRNSGDYNYKSMISEFDRTKKLLPNGYGVAFEWNVGVPIMRVTQNKATVRAILDQCNSTTGWAAGGNGTGLALDNSNYYDNGGALKFNLAASGSQGTLTKTLTSQDFTAYLNLGVIFLAVYIPSTDITSIGVKFGSSASNYYTNSNTTGFVQSFQAGQWFLVPLNLATATTTGTPDITKITYLQVFYNYNGTAQTNVYLGQVFMALPFPHTMIYGSSAVFLPSGGAAALTTITSDTDSILFNDAAYTLYQLECAKEVAFQQGGTLSSGTIQTLSERLDKELYPRYQANNPSQQMRTVGNWYDD